MNARTLLAAAALLAATTLTACGGGGASGGSLTPPSGNTGSTAQSVQSQTEDSIDTANDVGSPMKDITSYNEATGSPLQSIARRTDTASADALGDGTCSNGVEFFAPDKKGDANSTERIVFYDNGCTQIQSDAVRIYTPTSTSSETVQRTVSRYKLGGSAPAAVRTETVNYINASFDQFGYPVYKNGFDRTHAGELDVNGVKTIDADGELALQPSGSNSATFCADSAGFNATGNASLNETFGWAGQIASGTRTVNSDGSITWSLTHQGNTYTGPIGGLSIGAGAQNTACPISTPMFTLAGGTLKGQYNVPIQATYAHSVLSNLTISNATLANGDTLNVQTNAGVSPGDEHFISGTLAKNGTTIANFNVDAFGDGTLVVAASGQAYQIQDWHVVK
ncbi:MAG TPA: hypothetical protein VJP85_01535 [Candidatus Baltobacteraceae bacterium]|nr:hypothetical protein [Candidatus Baltobacteraceae bacterium]